MSDKREFAGTYKHHIVVNKPTNLFLPDLSLPDSTTFSRKTTFMTFPQSALYIASLLLATSNAISPATLDKLISSRPKATTQAAHLFQSKPEPRVKRTTVYDGPFKHGSPMLTHQEDSAAIKDCFASFHLPKETARFSDAI